MTFRFSKRDATSGYSSTVNGSHAWGLIPALVRPFAEALYSGVRTLSDKARQEHVQRTGHFLRFLASWLQREGTPVFSFSLSDLRSRHFEAYIAHLDAERTKDGSPYSDIVKAAFLAPLRKILTELRRDRRYSTTIPKSEDLVIRINPWPGHSRRATSRPPIAIADLTEIEVACLREISHWTSLYEEGNRLVAEGQELKATAPLGDTRLSVVLARLVDDLPLYLTNRTDFIKAKPKQYAAMRRLGGAKVLLPYLCATIRTLQPFIVQMAVRTAFNGSSIRTMSEHAVRPSPMLPDSAVLDSGNRQVNRVRLVARKSRARRDQIRTFPVNDSDPMNPVALITTVRRLTERLRPLLDVSYRDRLFIFPAKSSGKSKQVTRGRVRGLMEQDQIWKKAFNNFVQEKKLPAFTMSRLRPTISELTDLLSGGDLKAQQVILNHRQIDTTDRAYVSDEGRSRRQERLAEVLNGRERYIVTNGRFDPRGSVSNGTHRAVMQGFECYDPYDSPIPGQSTGTLCTAWGECPACPLGSVNPNDPTALAHLVQLDQAIEEAKERLTPARWLHWGELQQHVRARISAFKKVAVWEAAREINVKPLLLIE